MKKNIIDLIIGLIIFIPAYLINYVRGSGIERFPITKKILLRRKIFPLIKHYYEPLFDFKDLDIKFNSNRNLPGIYLDINFQLSFLKKLKFSEEIQSLNWDVEIENNNHFYINNGSFEEGDAEILFQFIRTFKPKKIIEIGCGASTKIIQQALTLNKKEDISNRLNYKHILIEPFEAPWLDSLSCDLIRKKVETIDLDFFSQLESSDFLFIDSSHIIKPQGDVLFEYLEILPILKKGAYVHIHDIFTPREYPKKWIIDKNYFWNEQYILEALLSNSNRYKICAAINFLKHNSFKELKRNCLFMNKDSEPGSIYLRIEN